jgi:hypothetical protein
MWMDLCVLMMAMLPLVVRRSTELSVCRSASREALRKSTF